MSTIRDLWLDDSGATMSEYALALCVVALGTIVAIRMFAGHIGDAFESSSSGLTAK
jgi:Flp pilus assembly pilin Flp